MTRTSIVCILLAVVTLLSGRAALGQTVGDMYGIRLAAPKSIPAADPADTSLRTDEDKYLRLLAQVDTSGVVTAVAAKQLISTEYLERLNTYFKRLTFEAGRKGGIAIAQTIPFTVYLFADNRAPELLFPVDSIRFVADADLFAEALELNGVVIPKIKRFPWYHFLIAANDTMPVTRYVLCSMGFSTKGIPTRIGLAGTNQERFAGQLLNAANWGKYSAATIDQKPVAGMGYLLVTFYPTVHYPVKPFKSDVKDSILTQERLGLKLLPDTCGVIMKPVPRFVSGWQYELTATSGLWNREGVFRMAIDSVGRSTLISGGNGSDKAKRFGTELASRLRFFPSIDSQGRPVSYEGAVRVTPAGKQNVRVEFLWLE